MTERRRSKESELRRSGALALAAVTITAALTLQSSCTTTVKPVLETDRVPSETASSSERAPEVGLSSGEVVDGSVLVVDVKLNRSRTAATDAPEGEFEGALIPFYPAPWLGDDTYQALVGIPHSHKTGPAHLIVRHAGRTVRAEFVIKDANYRSETLRVQERKINPLTKDLSRIRREQKEVGQAYASSVQEKLWSGPFLLPIDSPVTSAYGTKRVYNGQLKSFHSGVDLRAPVGTVIRAPASGVVVLAKDLFFTGNTVIVDHGYGLMTLYAHMSRIRVKKGQKVEPRQLLGLAGQTGRVSGPHLHWMALVNRVKVNPLELMKALQQARAPAQDSKR